MSSGPRSTSPAPLQGLLVIALVGILWAVAGSISDGPFMSSAGKVDLPNGCAYQVFQDGVCRGTLLAHNRLPAGEIVQRTGCRTDCTGSLDPVEIPCDCAVILHEKPPCMTLAKIRGEHLLIAGRPIDLNRADYRDLQAVPGIGRRLSKAIIRYREDRGSFSSVDELTGITGLGSKKLAALKTYLHVVQSD